ncbi:MAG: hypothetical protein A2Z73_05750 [Deltaproteobacteria bacterium RBG_13_60_28]|nr:MAG: hypothetical protein A2Z73_05750 [Deltaproteobacteria bacterium RBG_13_60_28]
MGWRHKKAGTPGDRELWKAALPTPGQNAGIRAETSYPIKMEMKPALPHLAVLRLSYRQLGYFRRREIWESGLSISYLH